MIAGEYDAARDLATVGLEIAEEVGAGHAQASLLITRGTAYIDRSDSATAQADLERGTAIAEQLRDLQQLTRGLNNLAESAIARGDRDRAFAVYVRWRRELEQLGLPHYLRWLDVQEASMLAVGGDWDRSLRLIQAILAHLESGGTHYLERDARNIRGGIRYARGETNEGVEDLQHGLAASRAARDPQSVVPALGSLAELLAREGRTMEARTLLAEALDLCRGLETPYYTMGICMAIPVLDTGLQDAALEIFGPHERKDVWTDVTVTAWRGDLAAAAEALGRYGARWPEADFRLRAAAQLRLQGEHAGANEQLERALAFFREVGATQRIREAEKLLSATA
jgi:tetratricopeptide (TPR) repeat protein